LDVNIQSTSEGALLSVSERLALNTYVWVYFFMTQAKIKIHSINKATAQLLN